MDLLSYLQTGFYLKPELLTSTQITDEEFSNWQSAGAMPKASYVVNMRLDSKSFFGDYAESATFEYYAKGYVSWIGDLKMNGGDPVAAFRSFSERYAARAEWLFLNGIAPEKFKSKNGSLDSKLLDAHIRKEWDSFLAGIYGLCTKSGLPEDIADKELAVSLIDEVTSNQTKEKLTSEELEILIRAVALLDRASSSFAPHERERSSRQRCVIGVRKRYGLGL